MGKNETIKVLQSYPIIMGSMRQPSSKASERGVSQQFIDRGMQKEIGLSRWTICNDGGISLFQWTLTFYIHPGMRREIAIEPKHLPQIVDRLHALAVGVCPMDAQHRRLDDWCRFHTFGFGGYFSTSKDVFEYLRDMCFSWEMVAANVEKFGIETHTPVSE